MKNADTRKKHNIAIRINSLLRELGKKDNQVVAPTDKTDSTILMETKKYIELTEQHLAKEAARSSRERLTEIYDDAQKVLALHADMLSREEYNYIKTTIDKKAIPTVKLLIKDHKDKKENGD